MKKLLLLFCALLCGVSGAWAESKLSKAVAGTYVFDSSNPALTVNKGGTATITNSEGVIVIHHDDLSIVGKGANNYDRTYAAVVMRVEMPTTAPGSFSKFISLKTSSDYSGSIGLGVTTEGKLKGTWQDAEWSGNGGGVVTASAVTGDHTIVLLCNDGGTTIYLDNASTSVNNSGLKSSTKWTDLRIESAYASYVKSVYVFSGEQSGNISAFFSELSNVVTVANEETKSVSENSTATRFFVASGGTLTADAAYDLDKIEGAGDVTMTVDQTISGSANTAATGKLTINEGKTLTLGAGQSETNSIESFTSIELAGTIKHNNSVATLNNVTVPADKTGKIFAYDMGSTSDGFKLAGTTTLNGNLTVCNKYNFQMKVDNLAGSGTWLICGTTGNAFNAEGTASNEKAIINVAAATTFTGTINLNNVPTDSHPGTNTSQVTVQGNLVGCTLKKTTGDYFYYSGNNLNGTTLDGVILNSSTARITTSNTVNIKNLAGNNLNNTDHLYAFVGGGTINFYGVCDLTKKSDGTVCNSANIGYGSSANVIIKAGANVTAGVVLNSSTISSNAPITVEATATLTAVGSTHNDNKSLLVYSTNLTNNGTINLNADGRNSIVSTLSGSGTLNVASGSSISAPSVPNTTTLTGAGDVVLTTFPTTTAPTLSSWTGAIEFPTNSSASYITDIFNAWGNENSTIKLNDISGYFSQTSDPVIPTLNILENKTLTINNGFSDDPPVLSKLTGKGDINLSWTGWRDNFNLTIQNIIDFDGTLTTATAPINVTRLVLATEPAGDALLLKTSATGVTLSDIYVGEDDITAVCSKKVKTVADVTGYYVTNKQDAVDAIAPYISFIGSSVGKYTVTLGSTPYTNASELETVISGWATLGDCVEPTIAINMPTNGFYRFTSQNNQDNTGNVGKYLHNYLASGALALNTTKDKTTIFYVDRTNNKLLSYDNGLYLNNYNVEPAVGESYTWTIEEGAELGKYALKMGTTWYASDWNTTDNITHGLKDANALWAIEPVESLPVTITAAKYATLYSPVALTIQTGVKAYYISDLTSTEATLTEISTTIPAETPVILYADVDEATTYNFAITTADDLGATNKLSGQIATFSVSAEDVENKVYYTLQKNAAGNAVGLFPKTAAGTIAGFKAYLPASEIPSGALAKGFTFKFEDVDGISTVQGTGLMVNGSEIFNLAGQRMSRVQKGVNIVNGKKVLVK